MSKKQIDNRLDKFFEKIKKEEAAPRKQKETTSKDIKRQALKQSADNKPISAATPVSTRPRTRSLTGPLHPLKTLTTSSSAGTPASMAMAFPLDNQSWATLQVIDENNQRTWDQEEQLLIKQVTDQLTLAIENAQLFQQSQERAEELAILNEMSRTLSSQLSIDSIAQTIYQYSSRLLDTTNFIIALFEADNNELIFPLAINDNQPVESPPRPIGEGLTDYILTHGEALLLNGNIQEQMEQLNVEFIPLGNAVPALSWLGVPMLVGERAVGAIAVQSTKTANLYTEHHRDLLSAISNQAAIAIQNANLFEQIRERSSQLATLNEVISSASQTLDIREILSTVLEKTLQTMGFDGGLITMYNNTRGKLERVVQMGLPFPQPEDPSEGLEGSLCDAVFQSRKSISLNDIRQGAPVDVSNVIKAGYNTYLGVPLELKGQTLGTLCTFKKKAITINQNTLELATSIGRQVGFAIGNARLFQAIEESESRFRDVALSSADLVWEVDQEGTYRYISERVSEVLGYHPEEIIGQPFKTFVSEDDKQQTEGMLTNAIRNKQPLTDLEIPSFSNQGKEVTFLASGVPILDTAENAVGYRGVFKDITERKRNEKIQEAIFQIAEAALTAENISSVLHSVHEAVNTLMPAENFFVALYDEASDLLSFPYYVDQHDSAWEPQKPSKNLTSYVLKTGEALLVTPTLYDELVESGQVEPLGTRGVDWLGVPLRSGDKPLGVVVVQTYKTSNRLTERDRDTLSFIANQVSVALERKQSELELRTLFASMNDVILIVDKETRYLRIAPTNPSRLFLPSEELIGQKMTDIFPPEIHKPFLEAIEQAIESGNPIKIEYPLPIDDQEYWFDATISKLNDDQVFWVARDITERKLSEEAIVRQNEYLAAAAEIGRLVTSTLDLDTLFSRTVNLISERLGFYHAAIFIIEETGFNAVLREATGEAGEEMKHRQHSLAVGSKSVIGSTTAAGEPKVVNNTTEDPIHRPNPLLPETRAEVGIPLRVGNRVIGALDLQATEVGAFTQDDIAILQILADQIAVAIDNARSYELSQEAVREMREIDRLKSQFLANMSHELRTPLNSIIGFSRVILKGIDGPVTDLQNQDLGAIYNSGQHLLGLINDILDLSKIEAGKMELSFEDVNAADLITSVMSTVVGLVKDKPIKLVKNISTDLPVIRADPMRVRQVLLNLLSNASKFTEEGLITVSTSINSGPTGKPEIMISVTDTGPGISQDDQTKLFQPFSQVDASPTRKTGGTGLGLSICQHLVQMHGGRIGVQSDIGKGSTFYFTLPVQQTPETSDIPIDGRVILAIDDDEQVISLYERYLEPQGFHLVALTDPSKAKERVRQLKPYAVTLDIMMPGYDGWQVINDLKSDPETRDVPVIICSILEQEEKGFNLGAADYLVKPILEDDLINALNRLNSDGSIREVLVIDDDPDDLRLISKILNQHGRYKPVLAEGGEQGWEAINARTPHAVILDLFMPKMNGFNILEKMRSTDSLRDIPVIIVTGGDLTAEQHKQLNNFGNNLLKKSSLNEEDLLATLDRALKRVAR
jgi:PAS domain S-box-containing protein